jgi:RimJ/RimL family protein N-acetyltransferase
MLFGRLREWLPAAVESNEAYWRDQTSKRIASSGGWGENGLDLAIEVDGELVGAVQALGAFYHLPPNVYELGIEFYDADRQSQGLGTETLQLFLPPLFQRDGAIRIQGHTHVENTAMIRLFDRFGFQQEGLLRGYMPLPGRSGDVVIYGLTRDDYETAEATGQCRQD